MTVSRPWAILGQPGASPCQGPDEGWVSPSVSGKDIVVKVAQRSQCSTTPTTPMAPGFIPCQVVSQQEIGKITVRSSTTWSSLSGLAESCCGKPVAANVLFRPQLEADAIAKQFADITTVLGS